MDFDQFKIQVVDEMRERFPDLDIGIQAVSKLQGESYTGLAVSPADSDDVRYRRQFQFPDQYDLHAAVQPAV